MTRIAFRVDASNRIGTGHVGRCLSLAETLREQGASCSFVHRNHPGNMAEHIRARGFDLHELPTPATPATVEYEEDYAAWLGVSQEADARETGEALAGQAQDWLVVDHYSLGADWECRMRQHCGNIAVIDDLANRAHDCDLLIDQNYIRAREQRYDGLTPSGARRLCGPRYAILRPEYAEARRLIGPRRGPLSRVLIFYGGADMHNETGRSLRVLSRPEFRHLAVDVVVGTNHPVQHDVLEQARQRPATEIYGPRNHLVDLMIEADLALGGGGTTTWERCAVGLPSIVTGVAANQMAFNRTLAEDGAIDFLGHWSQISDDDLSLALSKYLAQPERLSAIAQTAWGITDGLGRLRVTEALIPSQRERLILRAAQRQDKAICFDWATDLPSHTNTASRRTVTRDIHDSWFDNHLTDPASVLWVMVTPSGLPVGHACIETNADETVIDYKVDSAFRGRDWGTRALELAVSVWRDPSDDEGNLDATRSGSTASCRAFLRVDTGKLDAPAADGALALTVLSDPDSWINESIPNLVHGWLTQGHRVRWIHNPKDLLPGDLCFLLGCGQLLHPCHLRLFSHTLVIHGSNLPNGRGWSPLTWQILEGSNRIPVTLLEAEPDVDSGDIYVQTWLEFEGHELLEELRDSLGKETKRLCWQFVDTYPAVCENAKPQQGEPTWYPKRRPENSELEPQLPIQDQFDLLRVVDNDRYPAFFRLRRSIYRLRIEKISHDR